MQENIDIDWADIARQAAEKTGLTQQGLATAIGVDQATISRIASRKVRDPLSSVALRLFRLAGGKVQEPESRCDPGKGSKAGTHAEAAGREAPVAADHDWGDLDSAMWGSADREPAPHRSTDRRTGSDRRSNVKRDGPSRSRREGRR